jgi:hypothetical protein
VFKTSSTLSVLYTLKIIWTRALYFFNTPYWCDWFPQHRRYAWLLNDVLLCLFLLADTHINPPYTPIQTTGGKAEPNRIYTFSYRSADNISLILFTISSSKMQEIKDTWDKECWPTLEKHNELGRNERFSLLHRQLFFLNLQNMSNIHKHDNLQEN